MEERGSIGCMNAFWMRRSVRQVVEATGSGARRWARGSRSSLPWTPGDCLLRCRAVRPGRMSRPWRRGGSISC